MDYIGDLAPIKASINQIAQQMNRTLRQIQTTAANVSSGSDQVSKGAQALSQGAAEQAGAIDELADSVSKISGQVENTAQNAVGAREQTNESGAQIAACNEKMQVMIEAIESAAASEELSGQARQLKELAGRFQLMQAEDAVQADGLLADSRF